MSTPSNVPRYAINSAINCMESLNVAITEAKSASKMILVENNASVVVTAIVDVVVDAVVCAVVDSVVDDAIPEPEPESSNC